MTGAGGAFILWRLFDCLSFGYKQKEWKEGGGKEGRIEEGERKAEEEEEEGLLTSNE